MKPTQTLYIKNMVCPRCIEAVRDILTRSGLVVESVSLGEASIAGKRTINLKEIDKALRQKGFELLIEKEKQVVEQIKIKLIEHVNGLESDTAPLKLSTFLSEQLSTPYTQLSKLFSKQVGHTIEKHFILLKIERVKELVTYGELTLSEIAYRLQYSSVQHLSAQFKSVTGLTVSDYKNLGTRHRHPLDAIG
jgi:AraC-like DNA-binding protein